MPRKLKVYQTSIGFYDLVIATPSMKAALEAWGAASNLFHQGFAKEAKDYAAIDAAIKTPGVVLRRPVGSNKPFSERADVPDDLPADKAHTPRKTERRSVRADKGAGTAAARRAAAAYEKQRRKDEVDRKKAEAQEAKARARRDAAIAKVQAQLDDARRKHKNATTALEAKRSAIDDQLRNEDERWSAEEEKLEASLKRAKKD